MSSLAEKLAGLDSGLDLTAEIARLRAERNAIILAHYYVEPEIQDLADILGDSLELARQAQATAAEVIVLCGVHFMAETAKILNPDKTVLIPDLAAGCSLADCCPPEGLAALKEQHPGHVVVSYVNTSAAIKALSDWCCTSSNAVQVVSAIPVDQPIIFCPDVNLGRWVQQQTGRELVLWQGTCEVHETFDAGYVARLLADNPSAELIAHPECEPPVLERAAVVGSTRRLLEHTQRSEGEVFVVATEHGIIHAMQKASPGKTFVPAAPVRVPSGAAHGCSTCWHMKQHTLAKVYLCLRDLEPAVELDETVRRAALAPIERMVSVG